MGQTNDKQRAKTPSARDRVPAARFDNSRFVQYELDTAEQAACKGWDVSSDDLWLELLAFADDGYSISLKFDTFSDSYACFVQVRGKADHANVGLILTGRGSTPAKAFKQAVFKHRTIGPVWGKFAEKPRQVIDD